MGGSSSKVPEPEDTITVKDPVSGQKLYVQNMEQKKRGICCFERPPEVSLTNYDDDNGDGGLVAMGYKTKRRSRKTRKRRKKQKTRKRPTLAEKSQNTREI